MIFLQAKPYFETFKLFCLILFQAHLNDGRKGEILRDGVKTVIIGSTNVGKSSLLNVLCKLPSTFFVFNNH